MFVYTTTSHDEDLASQASRKDQYWNDLAAPMSFLTLGSAKRAIEDEYREEYDEDTESYVVDMDKPALEWVEAVATPNPKSPRKRTWTATVGEFGSGECVTYCITEVELGR